MPLGGTYNTLTTDEGNQSIGLQYVLLVNQEVSFLKTSYLEPHMYEESKQRLHDWEVVSFREMFTEFTWKPVAHHRM